MKEKEELIKNKNKIHTTKLGAERIERNLKIQSKNLIAYCINKIMKKNSEVYKKGKNYYVEIDNIRFTINSNTFTIITAHKIK